jgi:hypothetical protein
MTAFNLIKSLTKRGNVVLGAGCYAAAIGSANSSHIIKIGNSMDDPWLDYYHNIIKTNQANPYVPKIKHFMCDQEHNFYVCVMERLDEEASVNIDKNSLIELCKDYTTHMITREEFVDEVVKFPAAVPCPDMLANLLDKIHEGTDIFGYGEDYEDGHVRRLDMHRGNFMFRDNLLVVTDPWSEADMSDIQDVSNWVESESIKTARSIW